MPCSERDLKRIAKLYGIIEDRKAHEHSAPTYKDSPYLKEMAEIVSSQRDCDVKTLEEMIPVLCYLAESYDKMCRAGMSVKLYLPLLEYHVRLKNLRGYDDEDTKLLENCFYKAAIARNFYEPDDCTDLVNIVIGSLPDERVAELLNSARDKCRHVKYDPIEKTEQYLAVIDEAEERIDREKTVDLCLEYWSLKAKILLEYGIVWRSPAELNRNILFD